MLGLGIQALRRDHAESADKQIVPERVGKLSDEFSIRYAGREAAVEAVHKFANTLEEATSQEGDPSRRKTLIEAAVNLADELSAAQMELLHSITRSTTSAIRSKLDEPQD